IVHAFENRHGGEIRITFEIQGNQLNLSFRDNGIGINKKSLAKIFEPFHTSKRGEGGSGLGLSIVYNLVTQKLRANVNCDSKLGEWTEFTLSIPIE
ncbi:ATP-binding protein, partial [Paraglaciecola sp.]|uniref:ATP-binding protein n=1 Tax=Paraglaciecola sp. TaxID=1920173 RepID=UPI003EF539C7